MSERTTVSEWAFGRRFNLVDVASMTFVAMSIDRHHPWRAVAFFAVGLAISFVGELYLAGRKA